MARKKKHAEHENSERWLLTYADMITLLVAFFIMLYAMSVVSKQKFEVLALSVRSGFDGNSRMQAVALSPGTGIAQSNAMIAPQHISKMDFRFQGGFEQKLSDAQMKAADAEEKSMDAVREKIEAIAKAHGTQGDMEMREDERGLTIHILTDKLLFAKGDGHLRPDSGWLLDGIASAVKGVTNNITVEGHTDNLAIHTAEYPSNWELSTARATSVLRYLVEHDHLPGDRLCAAGYADTRPLMLGDSETARSRNRRVDIVLLRNHLPDATVRTLPSLL